MSSFDVLMNELSVSGADDGIFVLESGETVEIVHVVDLVDVGHVAEVDGFDVALDFAAQFVPVEVGTQLVFVLSLVHSQLPPVVTRVYDFVVVLRSLMHQFFRDTAHVHTGAT